MQLILLYHVFKTKTTPVQINIHIQPETNKLQIIKNGAAFSTRVL